MPPAITLKTISNQLGQINQRLDSMDQRLDRVEKKLLEHDENFAALALNVSTINKLLRDHDIA